MPFPLISTFLVISSLPELLVLVEFVLLISFATINSIWRSGKDLGFLFSERDIKVSVF